MNDECASTPTGAFNSWTESSRRFQFGLQGLLFGVMVMAFMSRLAAPPVVRWIKAWHLGGDLDQVRRPFSGMIEMYGHDPGAPFVIDAQDELPGHDRRVVP